MFRKVVSVCFVALWFVLLGIEFSEDLGLVQYGEAEVNRGVVVALAELGEAIKTTDDLEPASPGFACASPAVPFEGADEQQGLFDRLRETGEFFKPDIPIYSLYQVFLI